MAVLVEGISVVIQRERIDDAYRGGWQAFVADCPNRTLCGDGYLARVGFMDPRDAVIFVEGLKASGLRSELRSAAPDFVVVDQVAGSTTACDWLDLGEVQVDGGRVRAARHTEDRDNHLVTPEGWAYEASLSHRFGYRRLSINADGLPQEEFISQGLSGGPLYSGRTYPEESRPSSLSRFLRRLSGTRRD